MKKLYTLLFITFFITSLSFGQNKNNEESQTNSSVVKNEIEGFAMYPNPVNNGRLFITSPSRAEKHVQIFTLIGNKVYDNIVQSREVIEIPNLTKGFYMIRVEEEGKTATRKLIIN